MNLKICAIMNTGVGGWPSFGDFRRRRRTLSSMRPVERHPAGGPEHRPTGLGRLIARIPTTRLGAAIHRALFAPIDATLMRVTGGRVSSVFGIVPLVVLRTTGARSGAQRDAPVGYFTDDDDVILIATNYGRTKHTSWYHNLLKHPGCQLLADGVEGRGGRFIAYLTEGADRDRLFALAQRYSPNYTVMPGRPPAFGKYRCSAWPRKTIEVCTGHVKFLAGKRGFPVDSLPGHGLARPAARVSNSRIGAPVWRRGRSSSASCRPDHRA